MPLTPGSRLDVSLTLSQVLQREPDFDALPADLPPAIRRLFRRCFEKDPRRQAFPGPGEAHRVTRDGTQDSQLWWRADGRQLMVIGADLQVLLIDLTLSPEFVASAPRAVGRLRFAPVNQRAVDATPDLKRMLAIVAEAGDSARSITVLKNWLQVVQQKAR